MSMRIFGYPRSTTRSLRRHLSCHAHCLLPVSVRAGCGGTESGFAFIFKANATLIFVAVLPIMVILPTLIAFYTLLGSSKLPYQKHLPGNRLDAGSWWWLIPCRLPAKARKRAKHWSVRFVYCVCQWVSLATMVLAGIQ